MILRLYFYHEFASGQVCLCHSLFLACSVSVQTLNLPPSMLILFDPPVKITFSHVIKECQFLLYMRFMKYIYTHFLGVSKFFLFLIVLTLTLDEISSVDPDGWFEGSTDLSIRCRYKRRIGLLLTKRWTRIKLLCISLPNILV